MTQPVIRRGEEIAYERVDAAPDMRKGVLIDESDGAPGFTMRRFVLDPGASVPKHTNTVEHEQYVLEGAYTIGLGEEEVTVEPGDSVLIPAGVVHWYRNDADTAGSFLCVVPHGEDAITLVEDE